ncbi:TadE/TadG family type IV pilus assembly protein [Pseudarthrobacter sp. J64]|uniref:TadE/TadG family type IV pilus assembly protein n=1 Tax=Pseudarthrobacter sp. J64 TaxID=3116485 RepID=UPI002E81A33B|nr:TadE/TadG family type IV pilus assembly protein [Pseudarthrobacter sp. J64]MEE2568113.1 TadE/TadG family type IV pilus assembly protein [Pseudarthrobacter sp. J64]
MSRSPSSMEDSSRGAIAVEFALVAPVLLLLVAGIIEFSNIFNAQVSVTQAAREAARNMAIHNNQGTATTAARVGAPGLDTSSFALAFSPTACAPNTNIKVTISYTAPGITGVFGTGFGVTGVGAMRCGG